VIVWRFTYDPMGRITEALDPERRVHRYAHDPTGDLVDHLPDTGRGLRIARHDQTEYRYDAAGNLAQRQANDDLTRFTWDEQNRLTTALTPDDQRIDMTYDALGRRHIKAVNGERTFFNWDGDALLSEQSEDENPREYVYYPGTFEPLALIDGGGMVYYYHNDLNGLPQELTRPNGEIVWSASYDAMGRVDQILADEVTQPLRFQGQYWDAEIDLCYNRHRYFDPQICSFISKDPLGLAAGENVYAYASNVWGWVDPLGLSCESTSGKAIIREYRPEPNRPHYTIDVQHGNNKYISEQLGAEGENIIISNSDVMAERGAQVSNSFAFDIPNAKNAMQYQKIKVAESNNNYYKGISGPLYDAETQSCLTHCFDVLRAGGAQNVPDTSKVSKSLYKYMLKHKV